MLKTITIILKETRVFDSTILKIIRVLRFSNKHGQECEKLRKSYKQNG